jgi:hypothetical protein
MIQCPKCQARTRLANDEFFGVGLASGDPLEEASTLRAIEPGCARTVETVAP